MLQHVITFVHGLLCFAIIALVLSAVALRRFQRMDIVE